MLIFLLANTLINLDYGTNPESRFAALCAMVEDKSFRIDHYKDLTIDWSQTPDGHYYSNKAPGPVLVAYPVFWVLDKWITAGQADRAARGEARLAHRVLSLKVLSLLFQALPFAILVMGALYWLQSLGASRAALHVSCVAMLFGNTAALFMNTYFGHAMAAACVLSVCLFLIQRRYLCCGLAYGFALLADYGSALLLPGFLAAVLVAAPSKKRIEALALVCAGGLLPGLLWILYHVSCFGTPFTLPARYQNPIFIDASRHEVLGLFRLVPDPRVLAQLLFGFQRGILWSQPWLLIVLVAGFFRPGAFVRDSERVAGPARLLLVFLLPGMVLLLLMNASFGEWQGGSTPGPRYICAVFPAFGLLAGLVYDGLSRTMRQVTNTAVAVSTLLWMVVYSTHILVPAGQTMWGFTLRVLFEASESSLIRIGGIYLMFLWQVFRLARKSLDVG